MDAAEKTSQSNNLTPIFIFLLIIAAFAVGALWTKVQYLEKTQSTASPTSPTALQGQPSGPALTAGNIRPVDETDHIRGSKNAKVTLVEYSDLECPFCKSFHPTMQQVMKEYDGKVRWVYRHFPLDSIHPKARPAANAAECVASLAGNEGFWNYIDKLFEGAPATLTDEQLKTIASGLGVNASQFDDCFKSKKFENKINVDLQDGQTGGITGTPGTIVIDAKGGKQLIPGALPLESVKQILDQALKN